MKLEKAYSNLITFYDGEMGTVLVPITKEQETTIDTDDFEKVNKYKWFYCSGYVARWTTKHENNGGKRKRILLHRFLTDAPEHLVVDHIDGNPLNNSKSNLRVCTYYQNYLNKRKLKNNSTGFKGVWYNKSSGKYVAEIYFLKKKTILR